MIIFTFKCSSALNENSSFDCARFANARNSSQREKVIIELSSIIIIHESIHLLRRLLKCCLHERNRSNYADDVPEDHKLRDLRAPHKLFNRLEEDSLIYIGLDEALRSCSHHV